MGKLASSQAWLERKLPVLGQPPALGTLGLPLTGGTSGNQCAVTGMDFTSKLTAEARWFSKSSRAGVRLLHRVTVLSLKCAAFAAFPVAETVHLETAA